MVHVWHALTGEPVAELENHGKEPSSLAFSSDSRWLATNAGDVCVFDTTNWQRVLMIAGTRVRAVGFDPTGPRLVTGTFGGDVSIWRLPDGSRSAHMREIGEPVDAVTFSPDGKLVATASRDGAEQIWKAESGGLQSQFIHHRSKINSIEFDESSRLVLSAGADGSAAVSDVELAMAISFLEGPQTALQVAHFAPKSHLVVGASWDGTVRVWDSASQYRRWASLPMSDGCGVAASLQPDRRFVAVSCRNLPTRIWDTAHDRLIAELPSVIPVNDDFGSAFPAVSPAGDYAAIARGNEAEIYSLPSRVLVRSVRHNAQIRTVAFGPDGHEVVSGAIDGTVLVTPLQGLPVALPRARAAIDAVALLGDRRVVVTDAARRLRIYDLAHGAMAADLAAPSRAMLLRPSSDGTRLITVPYYTSAEPPVLWDLEHNRLITPLEGHLGQVNSARFVRGDREVLTTGADGTVHLWDATTGASCRTYRGSTRFLADAVLDPSGTMVVAGGGDGLLRFWDVATGRPLWTLPAHKPYVVGLHFEGGDIVTRGFGGDVARWALPEPQINIEGAKLNSLSTSARLAL